MRGLAIILLALPLAVLSRAQTGVQAVINPALAGSAQASLSTAADGGALLSWVEGSSLKYAVRRGAGWSEVRTIAANRHFFRHPAELPEVIALSGGTLVAHWIETPKEDSEAEFIYVSASKDGVKWTVPAIAHRDRSQVQHGLASIVASGEKEASILWLQALKGEDGPVSLMRTVVTTDGATVTMTKEESLDTDVCACCPTSVVKTSRGLLVAYRDHTAQDIRDIAVTRFENGRWTAGKIVNADNWQLNACPTNAASAATNGDRVAISWYTASQEKPRVEFASSTDGGTTFSKAIVASTGLAYGYTSAVMDEQGGATISWLERVSSGAAVLVRRISATGVLGPVTKVAEGSRQSLGYPRLARIGKETWLTWNTAAKVQTARVNTP